MLKKALTFIVVVFILSAYAFASWAIVCGIIRLITMCFGLGFSFKVATGIWLVFVLLKFFFGSQNKT